MGLTFGIRKPLFSGWFFGVPKPTLYRTVTGLLRDRERLLLTGYNIGLLNRIK
jgi:hypothetical protein